MIKTKIHIKGYIYNQTEKTKEIIDEKGIKKNNKIIYFDKNIKNILKIDKTKIILIRENIEFILTLELNINSNTKSKYYLKESKLLIYINIKTEYIKFNNNQLEIKYKLLDNNTDYIYKIELKEENKK